MTSLPAPYKDRVMAGVTLERNRRLLALARLQREIFSQPKPAQVRGQMSLCDQDHTQTSSESVR